MEETQPLRGVTVIVTRPSAHGRALCDALAARGARAHSIPTIAFADPDDSEPIDRAIDRLHQYTWAIFTSRTGVDRFLERLERRTGSLDALRSVHVAAIGPATAAGLTFRGLTPDVVPERYVAEGLFEALDAATPLPGARVLVARAAIARDVLPRALRAAGATVDIVELYRTIVAEESRAPLAELLATARVDFVVFTSASTVENFVALSGSDAAVSIPAVCTGPIVAEAARALGFRVAEALETFSNTGVVSAIERLHAGPKN